MITPMVRNRKPADSSTKVRNAPETRLEEEVTMQLEMAQNRNSIYTESKKMTGEFVGEKE